MREEPSPGDATLVVVRHDPTEPLDVALHHGALQCGEVRLGLLAPLEFVVALLPAVLPELHLVHHRIVLVVRPHLLAQLLLVRRRSYRGLRLCGLIIIRRLLLSFCRCRRCRRLRGPGALLERIRVHEVAAVAALALVLREVAARLRGHALLPALLADLLLRTPREHHLLRL